MKLSEIGEFGLIQRLREIIPPPPIPPVVLGIGDDAAAWQTDGSTEVATTDSYVAGVHFLPGFTSFYDLGCKMMAATLSDIAAMGASARYVLVAACLPENTEISSVIELYRGLVAMTEQAGCYIIGGETCRSAVMSLTLTAIGHTHQPLLTRHSARPGDLVAVTGTLGTAAAGLKTLQGAVNPSQPERDIFLKAFNLPQPRLSEGKALVDAGVSTAIDISDGLVADLKHIGEESRVSAVIRLSQLPIEDSLRAVFGRQALDLALFGGEDYQLLFCAPPEVITRVMRALPEEITVIGEIISGPEASVRIIDENNQPYQPANDGWDHFRHDA